MTSVLGGNVCREAALSKQHAGIYSSRAQTQALSVPTAYGMWRELEYRQWYRFFHVCSVGGAACKGNGNCEPETRCHKDVLR
jgi:hypothetical protein